LIGFPVLAQIFALPLEISLFLRFDDCFCPFGGSHVTFPAFSASKPLNTLKTNGNIMNRMQAMSQKILTDRLKLELGLALEADVDYHTLKSISLEMRNERLRKMANAEASYLSDHRMQAA
jgi:hypothetical protein